jgi:hypothetical protein
MQDAIVCGSILSTDGVAVNTTSGLQDWISRELQHFRQKRDELRSEIDSPKYEEVWRQSQHPLHKERHSKVEQWLKCMLKISWLSSFSSQVEAWEGMKKMTPEFLESKALEPILNIGYDIEEHRLLDDGNPLAG